MNSKRYNACMYLVILLLINNRFMRCLSIDAYLRRCVQDTRKYYKLWGIRVSLVYPCLLYISPVVGLVRWFCDFWFLIFHRLYFEEQFDRLCQGNSHVTRIRSAYRPTISASQHQHLLSFTHSHSHSLQNVVVKDQLQTLFVKCIGNPLYEKAQFHYKFLNRCN